MKMRSKRLLSLLTVATAFCLLGGGSVLAAEKSGRQQGFDWTFDPETGTVEVVYTGDQDLPDRGDWGSFDDEMECGAHWVLDPLSCTMTFTGDNTVLTCGPNEQALHRPRCEGHFHLQFAG